VLQNVRSTLSILLKSEGEERVKAQNPEAKGIKSIEIGCAILEKIASWDQPMTITEISRECGMSASKVHHYLVSFCRVGFLQKEADGRYGVTLKLSMLGLKDTNQATIRKIVEAPIKEYAAGLKFSTVSFMVWGDHGPTTLLRVYRPQSIYLDIREGSTMDVTTSANGQVFAAFYDSDKVKPLVDKEIQEKNIDVQKFEEEIRMIRQQGYAVTDGGYVEGFTVVAAPVFNALGEMMGTLTVVGISGVMDVSPGAPIIASTLEKAAELSKLFGYKN